MQAILTKYLPATNMRGSRIKASCERGSVTIPYPHEFDTDGAHVAAAKALVAKFVKEDEKHYGTNRNPWAAPFVSGTLAGGEMVHTWPNIGSNAVVVECANSEDHALMMRIVQRAQASDASLRPLDAGLLSGILRQSKV